MIALPCQDANRGGHRHGRSVFSMCQSMALVIAPCLAMLLSGCSGLGRNATIEPVQELVEPERQTEYLLYRPSTYDANQSWPLIVVASGGMGASPERDVRRWASAAESKGFIVAAPKLPAATSSLASHTTAKVDQLAANESALLAVIEHVRAANSVSADRVFLHGYGDGALVALYTGLQHPDVVRAISAAQPKYAGGALPIAANRIDRFQPVYVRFQRSNMLAGEQGKECAEWLRSRGAAVRVDTMGHVRPEDIEKSVAFFEDVIRNTAWLRIEAVPTGERDGREYRFTLRSPGALSAFRWEFGDGDESPVADPIHVYSADGDYRVVVTASGLPNGPHRRFIDLKVPARATAPR